KPFILRTRPACERNCARNSIRAHRSGSAGIHSPPGRNDRARLAILDASCRFDGGHMQPKRTPETEPIETASVDELRTLQLQRLRKTLRHAYDNVPHYQRSFQAAGV